MKKDILCTLSSIVLFFITSCQKETSSEGNNSSQVLGKWHISSAVQWWTPTNGGTIKDTFSFAGEGLYRDFRNDGKVYSLLIDDVTFWYDTANYKIDGNNMILWNSNYRDTGIIQKLTSKELSLYKKTIIDDNYDKGVLELWNNLIK